MNAESCSIEVKPAGSLKTILRWFVLDAVYLACVYLFFGQAFPYGFKFIGAHLFAICIGTLVMYTGLGAGVLWIPILTFFELPPSEAVTISIFTQIAGKGMGSFIYLRSGTVDMKVARTFLPYTLAGVAIGYLAGFGLSLKYEKMLLYVFVAVALYLLAVMIKSLFDDTEGSGKQFNREALKKSGFIVTFSSFFTGLLSIGNSDWLIPHMERNLRMPTHRAVATGLFVMFTATISYFVLIMLSVAAGIRQMPDHTPLLLATCAGVAIGGRIGPCFLNFKWLEKRQKHAFIIMLLISIIHLLW
ncbi:MAG: sulfite exporter TauE/SafE family protein [Desulfobacteraceae bacterium]